MFQSLFCWKTLANVRVYLLRVSKVRVSILVLLEDPRQHFGRGFRRGGDGAVSILVLLEDPRQLQKPL